MEHKVLFVQDQEVRRILTMKDAIGALEGSFKELGEGRAVNRTRSHTHLPTGHEGLAFRFKTFEGGLSKAGFYGMRIFSDHLSYPTVAGSQRQVKKYFDEKFANGLAMVADITENRLVAIIADGWFSLLRVGGTSAVGSKYLARSDTTEVGLLGAGWQARGLAMGLKVILPLLTRIKVFSPDSARRAQFAEEMSSHLGIPVQAVGSDEEAMENVQVIATATNSMVPVVKKEWLREGIHVVAGAHACEVPDDVISEADIAIIAQHEVGLEPRSPDLEEAVRRGKMVLQGELQSKRSLDWGKLGLLCDLVSGKKPGRQDNKQITLMINNFGLGTQYAALGALVYKLAEQGGLGYPLPYSWFVSEYSWNNPGAVE
jgi:ornithine cyclodeaminase/alanine dehydrogenase-like protein (mu-crystallin family)